LKAIRINVKNYIFAKLLIDKNGVIVGRYGEGGKPHEAMDSELKEIFGY